MKVKIALSYLKTTPKGAVYVLSIDGLETKPELVLPVLGDKRFALQVDGEIDLGKEVELHPAKPKPAAVAEKAPRKKRT